MSIQASAASTFATRHLRGLLLVLLLP